MAVMRRVPDWKNIILLVIFGAIIMGIIFAAAFWQETIFYVLLGCGVIFIIIFCHWFLLKRNILNYNRIYLYYSSYVQYLTHIYNYSLKKMEILLFFLKFL